MLSRLKGMETPLMANVIKVVVFFFGYAFPFEGSVRHKTDSKASDISLLTEYIGLANASLSVHHNIITCIGVYFS